MFLDNCRVHHSKNVKEKWDEYQITPIWNVPYHFAYNDACEKYWAQLKSHFRPLLLKKMLENPHPKHPVLKESVLESIRDVKTDSIPKFIAHGLTALRHDANLVRQLKNIPLKPFDYYKKI